MIKKEQTGLYLMSIEGTRSYVEYIRTGFYYIAKEANVPIIIYSFDYRNKEIIFSKAINISDKSIEETVDIINNWVDENNLKDCGLYPDCEGKIQLKLT